MKCALFRIGLICQTRYQHQFLYIFTHVDIYIVYIQSMFYTESIFYQLIWKKTKNK